MLYGNKRKPWMNRNWIIGILVAALALVAVVYFMNTQNQSPSSITTNTTINAPAAPAPEETAPAIVEPSAPATEAPAAPTAEPVVPAAPAVQ